MPFKKYIDHNFVHQQSHEIKKKSVLNLKKLENNDTFQNVNDSLDKLDFIILQIMNTSIDIITNAHLKGIQAIMPRLPGIPPSSVVKISQGHAHVYIRYDPSPDAQPGTCQLPKRLCEENKIQNGGAQVSVVQGVGKSRKARILVSELEWGIINNNAMKLEQQFLNQISIIWDKGIIPLFYNNSNCVTLHISCEQTVGQLGQNSQLQIQILPSEQSSSQEQKSLQQTIPIENIRQHTTQFGNINMIKISKSNVFEISDDNMYQMEIVGRDKQQETKKKDQKIPVDTNILSVKEQLGIIALNQKEYQSGTTKEKIPTNSQREDKITVPIQLEVDQGLADGEISVDFRFMSYIGFPDFLSQITMQPNIMKEEQSMRQDQHKQSQEEGEDQRNSKFSNQNLQCKLISTKRINPLSSHKLDFLLSSKKGFKIQQIISDKDDSLSTYTQYKKEFVHNLIKLTTFPQKNQQQKLSLTIYTQIPFVFDESKIGYIKLFEKQTVAMSDPLTIILSIGQDYLRKIVKDKRQCDMSQQVQKQIDNKFVQINNCFYPITAANAENGNNISTKVHILANLRALWEQDIVKRDKVDHNNQLGKQQLFVELYKLCYRQEIEKLINLLQSHEYSHKNTSDQSIKEEHRQQKMNNDKIKFILISSFSNNGKTILKKILQHKLNTNILYIDMNQFDDSSLTMGDVAMFLQMCFQLFKGKYIFMDNFDSVCYQIDAGDLHRRQERIASKLIIRQIVSHAKIYHKVCIMTAKNEANIDEEFLGNYQHVKLKNPTLKDRIEVLRKTAKYNERQVQQMAESSESMSFGQFSKYAITGQKPQIIGQNKKKQVKNGFDKLAGVQKAKKLIKSMIFKPLKYSFVFKKLPVKLSRAVLLYGGSGTGKSAIGAALADQFQMKYFSVKGSDILSKYIGGSQAAVRDIFEKAMSVSPSIIFFDEFETIVPRRNSSNTGVTDRVVNQFLCYLDGVASIDGVFIVAASSRPDMIDPALLRPGRIDSHVFLDYPSSEERKELFDLYSNSITLRTPIEQVLEKTEHFSYSDLIGLIKQLRIKKSSAILSQKQNCQIEDIKEFKIIEPQFLQETLGTFKISVSKSEQQKQRKVYQAFERGDAPDISKQKSMLK